MTVSGRASAPHVDPRPPISGRRRRPVAGLATIGLVVVLLFVLATRMLPHPVGPARTYGKYEGKAVTTAKAILSGVQTVRLAAETGSRGNAFGPYLSVVISDAEDGISGLQGTFDSVQPPNDEADELHQTFDAVVSDALDHVRDVRVAVRRGELEDLQTVAEPLARDASRLEAFVDRHSP
jgi:hypothetical protein